MSQLSRMLRPDYHPAETRRAYVARRRLANRYIEKALRGKLAHVSTEPLRLPILGVDPVADKNILEGRIRDVKLITTKTGEQYRVGRTKGVTYRKPEAA